MFMVLTHDLADEDVRVLAGGVCPAPCTGAADKLSVVGHTAVLGACQVVGLWAVTRLVHAPVGVPVPAQQNKTSEMHRRPLKHVWQVSGISKPTAMAAETHKYSCWHSATSAACADLGG